MARCTGGSQLVARTTASRTSLAGRLSLVKSFTTTLVPR
jgi:hypothetical protein